MSKLLAPGKAQEQGRRCRNCSKELINPEISWPPCSVSLAPRLQPGEKGRTKNRSRFNGLGAGWQTVETVRSVLAPYCTGLKPAKATVLMRGQMSPSMAASVKKQSLSSSFPTGKIRTGFTPLFALAKKNKVTERTTSSRRCFRWSQRATSLRALAPVSLELVSAGAVHQNE